MHAGSAILLTAASGAQTPTNQGKTPTGQGIVGGRWALVLNATQYDASCFLQIQGPQQKWSNVNLTAFSADGVYVFDLPAGQYAMVCGGTTSNMSATLARVPV